MRPILGIILYPPPGISLRQRNTIKPITQKVVRFIYRIKEGSVRPSLLKRPAIKVIKTNIDLNLGKGCAKGPSTIDHLLKVTKKCIKNTTTQFLHFYFKEI